MTELADCIKSFNNIGYTIDDNGCWIWNGTVQWDGYANCREWKAHRLSWTIHKGEIPKGRQICHKCDIRNCVNPEHLFVCTQKENWEDCLRKGRWELINKRKSFPLRHWGLSNQDALNIIYRIKYKMVKKTVISREYNIGIFIINNILNKVYFNYTVTKGGVSFVE